MEQRLIDADALMEDIIEKIAMYDSVDAKMGLVPLTIRNDLQGFVETINEQPTIDAVPVRHGEWIIKPHGTYGQLRAFCSACGKHSGIGGIVSNQKKPYCPNCGAVMDGKENDNAAD